MTTTLHFTRPKKQELAKVELFCYFSKRIAFYQPCAQTTQLPFFRMWKFQKQGFGNHKIKNRIAQKFQAFVMGR